MCRGLDPGNTERGTKRTRGPRATSHPRHVTDRFARPRQRLWTTCVGATCIVVNGLNVHIVSALTTRHRGHDSLGAIRRLVVHLACRPSSRRRG